MRHPDPANNRAHAPGNAAVSLAALLLALWAVHALILGKLAFTGDEVRYAAYGLGIFHGQGFHPSDALWREMVADSGLTTPLAASPAGHAGRLIHSVVYPVLGSPALTLAGLDGARWLSFAVGALGLVILYKALRLRFPHGPSLAAVAGVAFACPLIFYLRLFFAEILLFTCNCLVLLFFLSGRHKNPANALWAALGLCLLPFVHVKLSLEAATAFLIVYAGVRKKLPRSRQLAMFGIAAGLFVLFLLYNKALFGLAVGGGNPAFPVTLLAVPDRVLTNLLDMRHGLIPNAPHLLLGLIGLFCFIWKDKDQPESSILVLFVAYFCTMLWANGSEAYAARNWTAAMPFVAFGLARWLDEPGRVNKWLALPLFLLSLCLTCVLFKFPNAFLDSRNYSVPFDKLFTLLPCFQFGYLLPYDFLDHEGTTLYASLGLGLGVAAVLGLFAAGQVLAARSRLVRTGAAAQALALAVIVFFSLVTRVENVATSITRHGDAYFLNYALSRPSDLAFVRIDNPDAAMKPYGFFTLALIDGQKSVTSRVRASAVVPLPPFTTAKGVMIAETPPSPDKRWLDTATGAALYRRMISMKNWGKPF
ncbi:hypothetical protein DesfrDRAFT_2073 [Solidesulfovibrio fructosivorans JJ]]|uniref:Glycosyltransferase RgtA/B/C/D-like domain-containing protein n=1 Tax=Solidesulfovibrio fructosivorans JJ] TaxID=596151 RepID=E1JWS4_SOLFR|nr:hypothetical protein [Solidesulfovibrio fructosivorans]EFL51128.1 hypothetical protein DesfrDRAFT_2073 [Solidesulfovibrio fructosivorans JJ]]